MLIKIISKLIETKNNAKYLIGIRFDKKAVRPSVLIMIKILKIC